MRTLFVLGIWILIQISAAYSQPGSSVVSLFTQYQEALERKNYPEAVKLAESAVQATKSIAGSNHHLQALLSLGKAQRLNGEVDAALASYYQAATQAEAQSDRQVYFEAYQALAQLYEQKNNLEKAAAYYQQLLKRDGLQPSARIMLLSQLAAVKLRQGKPREAEGWYQALAKMYKQNIASANELRQTYQILGETSRQQQHYEQAISYYDTAFLYSQQDPGASVTILNNQGAIYREIRQPEKAKDFFQQAARINASLISDQNDERNATLLTNQAVILSNLDDRKAAQKSLSQALDIRRKLNNPRSIARTYNLLGANALLDEAYEKARDHVSDAIQTAETAGDKETLAESYLLMSEIYKRMGYFKESQSYYSQYADTKATLDALKNQQQQQALQVQLATEQQERAMKEAQAAVEKQELMVRQLQLEAEKRQQDLSLQAEQFARLEQEKEIQTIQARQADLERARAQQALLLAQQRLDAEKRQQEFAALQAEKEKNDLILKQKALEEAKQRDALALLEQSKKVQDLELAKQRQNWTYFTWIGLLVLLLLAFALWIIFQTRRKNKKLHQQQIEIAEKNAGLIAAQEAISQKNEELQASEEELKQNLEELHATQETLALQNEELRALSIVTERTDNAVIITNAQGQIEWANEGFSKITGYTLAEVRGKKPGAFLQGPDTDPAHVAAIRAGLQTGKSFSQEILNYGKNGQPYWLMINITPLFDQEGQLEKFIAVESDITESKTRESVLQANNATLSKALDDLKSAQEQLVQAEKMASLGQLIASVAHEINTPLGAIRSSASNVTKLFENTLRQLPELTLKLNVYERNILDHFISVASQPAKTMTTREKRAIKYEIIEELEQASVADAEMLADLIVDMGLYDEMHFILPLQQTPMGKDILVTAAQVGGIIRSTSTINIAVDRASKVVFALKNFSRQDHSGKRQKASVNDGIETVLVLYHNQLKQGIEINKKLATLPEVYVYPDELVQVWTNIIHNAIHAMQGRGTLTIASSLHADRIIVSIGDSGTGIPEEIRDKIFNPFFTTKKAGEGSGLGMDIVRKIVEKHEGKIWFETEMNVGTTFFVELPVVLKEEA